MPTFQYQALTREGKRTSGSISASSSDEAIDSLRQQGMFTTSIRGHGMVPDRRQGILDRLKRRTPGRRSG